MKKPPDSFRGLLLSPGTVLAKRFSSRIIFLRTVPGEHVKSDRLLPLVRCPGEIRTLHIVEPLDHHRLPHIVEELPVEVKEEDCEERDPDDGQDLDNLEQDF